MIVYRALGPKSDQDRIVKGVAYNHTINVQGASLDI